MRRTRRMPIKTLIAALGAAVALAPTAAARVPDVLPPPTSPGHPSQDLRSPDARAVAVQSSQDLRSPDARDAATAKLSRWQAYDAAVRNLTPTQRAVAFGSAKAPAPATSPSGDDYVDAPIAGGGVLAAVLLSLGGLVLVTRRRNASAPAVSS
jgi:hypothetical protein